MPYLVALWEQILSLGSQVGARAAGLGARELLRLEAAMPLYGHELTEDTTHVEARLDRFVDYEKKDFVGRTALQHSTHSEFSRRLIGYQMTDGCDPPGRVPSVLRGNSDRVNDQRRVLARVEEGDWDGICRRSAIEGGDGDRGGSAREAPSGGNRETPILSESDLT